MGIQRVGVSLTVAAKTLVDGLVEVGQVVRVGHLLAVVFEQRAQYLAVGVIVPLVAVVGDGDMLTLAVALGTGTVMDEEGTG